VTAYQPSPSAPFPGLLSRFPPEIVALARKCLPKIRRDFPVPYEIVYDYGRSVVLSFSMSERGYEAIVAVAISPRGVQLYFDRSVPDPIGLLEGTGSKVRYVTVKAASELDRGDIHELIKAAIKHNGFKPHSGPTHMIFKSDSKKPKPAAKSKSKPRKAK
jgi:hypothetical protein